jgi:hypothetical protein
MPFVKPGELIPADTLRGRMGKPNGLGWVIFGWTEFGDDNYYQGVYQQRRNRKWDGNGGFIIGKVQKNFFQKPAWPVNTITEARTITRNNFRNAVQAWQALTTTEKNDIRKIAHKKGKRGYDWFLSQTLKSF